MKKKYTLKYSARIKQKVPGEIMFWFSAPQSDRFQEVNSIATNKIEEKRYFHAQNEIRFYSEHCKEYLFETIITFSVPGAEAQTGSLRGLLSEERHLERTPLVTQIAASLPDDKPQALLKLMSYIINNFTYNWPVIKRGTKNMHLGKLSGDCGEYSSLFVATARAIGIPARNESGFVIYQEKGSVMEHAWASCYLNGSWKEYDPQYAQLDKDPLKYSGDRADIRLSVCHGFNIPLKPGLPNSFDLGFWKKMGLPTSKKEVQIMQPIFFACENEFEFEEKADLRN